MVLIVKMCRKLLIIVRVCALILITSADIQNYEDIPSLLPPYQSIQPLTQCDLSKLEFRIATLEIFISKKFDFLTTDLIDANKHLASLEYQTTVEQNGVAELRNEIRRLAASLQNKSKGQRPTTTNGGASNSIGNIDRKIDDIAQGTHLSTAALTLLTKDVYALKENVSDLLISVRTILNGNLESQRLNPEVNSSQNEQPQNCKEILELNSQSVTGIYSIKPNLKNKGLMVFCDMETNGGGWTVIQSRQDGSQNFYLDFEQYKMGFGNIAAEFWLGLENIYSLTGNTVNELLIELTDATNIKATAVYTAFSIGPEEEGYPLKVLGGYQGDAGDSLSYHAGQKFSTKDRDQDSWMEGSCAQSHGGGWWYRSCDKTNLNGNYFSPGQLPDELIYKGIYWNDFMGSQYSLLKVRMMIRPSDINHPPMA